MPSASFTSSRSYPRRSRRKGANRIPLPSRTSSGECARVRACALVRPSTAAPLACRGLRPLENHGGEQLSTFFGGPLCSSIVATLSLSFLSASVLSLFLYLSRPRVSGVWNTQGIEEMVESGRVISRSARLRGSIDSWGAEGKITIFC